ncbi:hypothetical protein MICRO8M_60267 [Microbacterium sp. 8M]|nr:hypothetical protein MICRO8M_60267 [Microbacterium sp. 8M]
MSRVEPPQGVGASWAVPAGSVTGAGESALAAATTRVLSRSLGHAGGAGCGGDDGWFRRAESSFVISWALKTRGQPWSTCLPIPNEHCTSTNEHCASPMGHRTGCFT